MAFSFGSLAKPSFFASIVFPLLLMGCAVHKTVPLGSFPDKRLQRFANLLCGKFSSKEQSLKDTSYFNISLVMTPIWPEKTDGIWLYVEQAMAAKPDKPYRQRVYKLTHPAKDAYQSDIYTIKNPQDFVGLQNDKTKSVRLTPDKIELKDGCAVTLIERNGVYRGGTHANECPSDLRGAKYATTKITLKAGELVSWDQGFDASGKQVWGATKGGYRFLKEY